MVVFVPSLTCPTATEARVADQLTDQLRAQALSNHQAAMVPQVAVVEALAAL